MLRTLLVAVGLLGAVVVVERQAAAQPPAKAHTIGILSGGRGPRPGGPADPYLTAFLARMRELGYAEGAGLRIETRWAEGDPGRLPRLAAELVASKVDLILAAGSPSVDAARRATRTTPIVMLSADPVAAGFVQSFSRPEGNLTGLSTEASPAVWGKRLELLKEVAPKIRRVAVVSRTGGRSGAWVAELDRAAGRLGITLVHGGAGRSGELPAAFAALAAGRPDGLIASDTPLALQYRSLIIEFASAHRLPDVHAYREAAREGALLSYGIDLVAIFRRAAFYVDRLLKGARPADLPIEQPTTFQLVINARTARTLGLSLPASLLLRADEVIE